MEVSPTNRTAAWKLLCEADYLSRYWSNMHQSSLRTGGWAIFAQAGLAAGAFATAVTVLPQWAAAVANTLLVTTSVYLLVRPVRKSSVLKSVRNRCARIKTKAARMWDQIEANTISDAAVQERCYDLQMDLDETTEDVEIPFREVDTLLAAEQSNEYMDGEYGGP